MQPAVFTAEADYRVSRQFDSIDVPTIRVAKVSTDNSRRHGLVLLRGARMFTAKKYSASLVALSLFCNCGPSLALQPLSSEPSISAAAVSTPATGTDNKSQNRQNLPVAELPVLRDKSSVGKPTTSEPSFEPAVVINWGQLPETDERQGDRKSVVASVRPQVGPHVAAVQSPLPQHQSISQPQTAAKTAATVVSSARPQLTAQPKNTAAHTEKSALGAGKPNAGPASAAPAAHIDVVNVGWTASRRSLADGKALQTNVAFQSKECPHLQFASDRLVPVPKAESVLAKKDSRAEIQTVDAGQSQFTSLAHSKTVGTQPHPSHRDELRQLTRDANPAPPTISETYLDELQSLVQGPSVWLFTNGALLDLAPDEDEADSIGPTYLNDLESLSPDSSKLRQGRSQAPQRNAPQKTADQQRFIRVARENLQDERAYLPPSARGNYELGPEKSCEGVGGEAIVDKFSPLTSIRLSGGSSAPPQTYSGAENELLNRPDNAACAYLESSFPAFYQPPTQFGVRRPHRYPQKFCHNPLYFEDANLERCGQSNGCLTTVGSAIQFGTQIAMLPYLTTATHPDDCVETLGDCSTCQEFGPEAYFPRWSWKAAAVQAGAVTGGVFLFFP